MLNGAHINGKIQLLKFDVEKKCGRKILASSDCLLLVKEVYNKTGTRLSFNTLRRCFDIMQSNSHPSLHTLDTLSSYCGFASFGDYCAFDKPSISSEHSFDDDPFLNYAVHLFESIKLISLKDSTFFQFVHQTIKYLEERKFLIDQFQKRIAKTINGQAFYFEYSIHLDKLNAYYGSGLKYYLFEKKTKEGQIFGHSLLCFKNWLTQNSSGVKDCFLSIKNLVPDLSSDPTIWGRYFAAQLYFYDEYKINKKELIISARSYYESIAPAAEPLGCSTCFELILSEALLLTKEFEETLFYIAKVKEKGYNHDFGCIDLNTVETIYIFEAKALVGLGKFRKSRELFNKINPDNFSFLSKQYCLILYYTLKLTFNKGRAITKQLDSLIEQTGFSKLKEYSGSDDSLSENEV